MSEEVGGLDAVAWGQVFRAVNVVLALAYLPVLLLRIQFTHRDQVLHAVGDGCLVLAVIVGGWVLRHAPFIWSQPLVTGGLVIMHASGFCNNRRRRSQQTRVGREQR
jgi:uncharacterized membrane protein